MADEQAWPVLLRREPDLVVASLEMLADAACGASRSVPQDALTLARNWAPRLPLPGHGSTSELWQALATVGAVSLSVARTLEPHLDALAILAEAGHPRPSGVWGVFAAEGPGARLRATPRCDEWVLDGRKPWCSLAGHLDQALVTAWVDDTRRGLFAVDLGAAGVHVAPAAWHARGLPEIVSGSVEFDSVSAAPVGLPGWYLERNGFAWGGMGVAAIWYGACVGVARRLLRQTQERSPDQIALVHLGNVDVALSTARAALADAAQSVDAGRADGETGALLALRVRQVVADCVERVLTSADHALGPAPLALEPDHAARVADLRLYVRQHHAERDAARLGSQLLARNQKDGLPW